MGPAHLLSVSLVNPAVQNESTSTAGTGYSGSSWGTIRGGGRRVVSTTYKPWLNVRWYTSCGQAGTHLSRHRLHGHREHDESHAILVLALVFLVAVSLIVLGLLDWTGTSLQDTTTFAVSGRWNTPPQAPLSWLNAEHPLLATDIRKCVHPEHTELLLANEHRAIP